MTTVRIAYDERRIPPGPMPDHFPTHVIVLADDAGRRDLPIWLLGRDSHRFSLFEPPQAHQERAGTGQARDGLDKWMLGGSFTESAIESHWQDYSCAAEHGIAVLSSAVPQPEGFALLAQDMYADDYRDAVVVFSGQVRTEGAAGRAGLCLWVRRVQDIGRPMTEEGALGNPDNHIVMVGNRDWTRHQITVRIPGDASIGGFGIFLAGPGRIELRDAELTRATT
jgi:hypothetical protein